MANSIRLLTLAVVLATRSAGAQSPPEPELDLDFERRDRSGFARKYLSSTGGDGRAPLSVHLLCLDLDRVTVRLSLALNQVLGQETPS